MRTGHTHGTYGYLLCGAERPTAPDVVQFCQFDMCYWNVLSWKRGDDSIWVNQRWIYLQAVYLVAIPGTSTVVVYFLLLLLLGCPLYTHLVQTEAER